MDGELLGLSIRILFVRQCQLSGREELADPIDGFKFGELLIFYVCSSREYFKKL